MYIGFRGFGDADWMSGNKTITPFSFVLNRIFNWAILSVLDTEALSKAIAYIKRYPTTQIYGLGFSVGAVRLVKFVEKLKEEGLDNHVKLIAIADMDPRAFLYKQAEMLHELDNNDNKVWYFRAKEDNFANNSTLLNLISFGQQSTRYDYECD